MDLKNQRDKLKQYQKRIAVITTRETEIAKECLRNDDKQRALLALRRKKYQESLLSKTDQQLAQLEALTADVEFALIQKDVLFGLQQGTSVLKEIHKEMGGLDKVEMIMGESEEARAYQKVRAYAYPYTYRYPYRTKTKYTAQRVRWYGWMWVVTNLAQEISEMLGGRMSNQDEEEVEDELEALEREVVGARTLPDAPNSVVAGEMPEVPDEVPVGKVKESRQAVAA